MAATSTYSTVACVVFFGLKRADSLSRRSSGTLAIPTCSSRECRAWASSFVFVRILNSEVLPTCGKPMIPVFMTIDYPPVGLVPIHETGQPKYVYHAPRGSRDPPRRVWLSALPHQEQGSYRQREGEKEEGPRRKSRHACCRSRR